MFSDSRFKNWYQVQAYKHDGNLHRVWSHSFLVEETDEYWALASRMSAVTEFDGRKWMTKEPAIFILYKHKWMNVIAMFKDNGGICYYVNVASPCVLDKGYLKYIDYDLDVKLYPDLVERTLDEKEFVHNAKKYGYSEDLIKVINKAKDEIIRMMENKEPPFIDEMIRDLYARFLKEGEVVENEKN